MISPLVLTSGKKNDLIFLANMSADLKIVVNWSKFVSDRGTERKFNLCKPFFSISPPPLPKSSAALRFGDGLD